MTFSLRSVFRSRYSLLISLKVHSLPFSASPKTVCASILGAATVVVVPFLLRGYTAGHDLRLHVSWWLEFSRQFHEGILRPRWAELAYHGYGEPAFLFYPPLSLYLGGVLTFLLPFRMPPGAYVWLVMVLAGFSFYYLCRTFFDTGAALAGAVVYILSPYHLLEVHARSSMAELLVSAWLPFLLLAIYRLDEPGSRRIAVAAVWFAIIALTNVPLAVVTAYGALAFVIALALARKSGVRLLLRFAGAGALGVGVAGFFLVPAWFEKRWVLASVHPSFLPETQFVWRSALSQDRWMLALAGTEGVLIVLGWVAWMLCWKTMSRDAFWAFTVLLITSTILVLPFSSGIWRVAPALSYVQFPWRWLGPMGVVACFFVAAGVQQSRKGLRLAVSAATLSLILLATFTLLINTRADDLLRTVKQSFSDDRGYMGWTHALPREIKLEDLQQSTADDPSAAEVSHPAAGSVADNRSQETWQGATRIDILRSTAEARELVVDATQPAWIRFRLFRYPGWNAYVDGKPSKTISDARGAIVVQVPAGRSHVSLLYQRTPDQKWGLALSACSLVVLLWMFYGRRTHAAAHP